MSLFTILSVLVWGFPFIIFLDYNKPRDVWKSAVYVLVFYPFWMTLSKVATIMGVEMSLWVLLSLPMVLIATLWFFRRR